MKIVELNGKKYKIDGRSYGYSMFIFSVNGEESSITIDNIDLDCIEKFKLHAKQAVDEYELRNKRATAFKDWDGSL